MMQLILIGVNVVSLVAGTVENALMLCIGCMVSCSVSVRYSVYVAQLDRASAYEAGDCGFESRRGLHFCLSFSHLSHTPSTLSTSFTRQPFYHSFSIPSPSHEQFKQPAFSASPSTNKYPSRPPTFLPSRFLFQTFIQFFHAKQNQQRTRRQASSTTHTNGILYTTHLALIPTHTQ